MLQQKAALQIVSRLQNINIQTSIASASSVGSHGKDSIVAAAVNHITATKAIGLPLRLFTHRATVIARVFRLSVVMGIGVSHANTAPNIMKIFTIRQSQPSAKSYLRAPGIRRTTAATNHPLLKLRICCYTPAHFRHEYFCSITRQCSRIVRHTKALRNESNSVSLSSVISPANVHDALRCLAIPLDNLVLSPLTYLAPETSVAPSFER